MFVAITDTDQLLVDHFGLTIGAISVGLAPSCTPDDVYRRYLDLLQLLRGALRRLMDVPAEDLRALGDATGADPDFVARRLAALQTASS